MDVLFYHTKPKPNVKRKTFAGIVNGKHLYIGLATCSLKDNFSKKIGRTIAEGRANRKPITSLYSPEGWTVRKFIETCRFMAGESVVEMDEEELSN